MVDFICIAGCWVGQEVSNYQSSVVVWAKVSQVAAVEMNVYIGENIHPSTQ